MALAASSMPLIATRPARSFRSYTTRAFYLSTANEGVKAEVHVIGDPDRIFLVFMGDYGQDPKISSPCGPSAWNRIVLDGSTSGTTLSGS